MTYREWMERNRTRYAKVRPTLSEGARKLADDLAYWGKMDWHVLHSTKRAFLPELMQNDLAYINANWVCFGEAPDYICPVCKSAKLEADGGCRCCKTTQKLGALGR